MGTVAIVAVPAVVGTLVGIAFALLADRAMRAASAASRHRHEWKEQKRWGIHRKHRGYSDWVKVAEEWLEVCECGRRRIRRTYCVADWKEIPGTEDDEQRG